MDNEQKLYLEKCLEMTDKIKANIKNAMMSPVDALAHTSHMRSDKLRRPFVPGGLNRLIGEFRNVLSTKGTWTAEQAATALSDCIQFVFFAREIKNKKAGE